MNPCFLGVVELLIVDQAQRIHDLADDIFVLIFVLKGKIEVVGALARPGKHEQLCLLP